MKIGPVVSEEKILIEIALCFHVVVWRILSNISRRTGPNFAIISSYESALRADDWPVRAANSSDFRGSFPNLRPILRIYDFLTKLRSSVHIDTFLRQKRRRTKELRRNVCRLVHFQSGKSHKTCRVPTFIHWHRHSVNYSYIDHTHFMV